MPVRPELVSNIADTTDLGWQRSFYQKLHQHPELSGQEEQTARWIAEKLAEFNCEVTTNIGGFGIVAVFKNGTGPTALMRADFDALPVVEKTGVEFAATNGHMHACGHDMHTTALLGLCQMMDTRRDTWHGTFIALFQPAEENGTGAAGMVKDQLLLKIPAPDVCFAQHIIKGRAGNVQSMAGPTLASCDSIEIVLTGRSAHGSMPHAAIDPTYAAAMIVVRLQGIVGREIPPDEFAVVSVGTLESGNSNNTIPGTARIVLNCRTYSDDVKATLYAAIERVITAEATASGMTVAPQIRYFAHGPLTSNDPQVFAQVRANFDAVFGAASTDATRWTASEDFSAIPDAFNAPYLYWFVGCTPQTQWDKAMAGGSTTEILPGNHMPTFLPEFGPTVDACRKAALTAVLSYLGI